MNKEIIKITNYQEIALAFQRKDIAYYNLNIKLQEDGEFYVCLCNTYDHVPTQEDKDNLYADYLAICKKVKLAEVDRYDKSMDVNGFYLGEQHAWLDKATRVGLANSIAIEKAAGKTETTLYLNGVALTIGIEQAQQMLSALELYALDCYRKTEEHKATINALTTIEEAENYDCTQGYPEQLKLEL
jgi:hypothetical protein